MAKHTNFLPELFSTHYKVDPAKLKQAGLFDPVLNLDTKLFIDPVLLVHSSNKTIATEGFDKFQTYFEGVAATINMMKAKPERAATLQAMATRQLVFPEFKETCLGYGSKNTSGSAIGPDKARKIVNNAITGIELGVIDPRLFMAVMLFEDGIGPDLISDMTSRIIQHELASITATFCKENGIPTKAYVIDGTKYALPENPHVKRKPVLLVPSDILRDLPIATDYATAHEMDATSSAETRARVSALIGNIWAQQNKKEKAESLDKLLSSKQSLEEFLKYLTVLPARPYNLEADVRGEVKWVELYNQLIAPFLEEAVKKLNAVPTRTDSVEELDKTVGYITGRFQDAIHNKGLWRELWTDATKTQHRNEKAVQRLLYLHVMAFRDAYRLDVSVESDAGAGQCDFKVSVGDKRVVLEVKLSDNSKLVHGYETQLEKYKAAEDAARGHYVIVKINNSKGFAKKIAEIRRIKAKLEAEGKPASTLWIIDGLPKASASIAPKVVSLSASEADEDEDAA